MDGITKMRVNELYTDREVKVQMREFFQTEGFIQLNNFLEDKNLDKIKGLILNSKFNKIYDPLVESSSEVDMKSITNPELIEFIEYFKSKEFIEYIEEIVDSDMNFIDAKIKIYEHRDFIILNDERKNIDCLDIIFDISEGFEENMGGIYTYTTREEELLYLEPMYNTISIVDKPSDIMTYLKYINNKAKDKKIVRIEIKLDYD